MYMYMEFITERFSKVAIESWPEWDSNPRLLNCVQNILHINLPAVFKPASFIQKGGKD